MPQKKNMILGKVKFFLIFTFIYISFFSSSKSQEIEDLEGKFIEIKVLDKVSSKSTKIKLEIEKEKKFKNLIFKAKRCKNSEFDDDPEVAAYLQVRDITQENNNKVFIFNGWTFLSSPSLRPFEHPVYDIWLTKCYN